MTASVPSEPPAVTTKYTEYTDESGVKAMVYEPENDRAWIQSTFRVTVEQ